jgi:hypothetical protein
VFPKINRAQLLAVSGWSTRDLDSRIHDGHFALAHGLTLPIEKGSYIGFDCFVLRLMDALAEAGFSRAQAARFVRDYNEQWLHGVERIEWPQLHPPPDPMTWALTKQATDEGITEPPPPDIEIYFAVATNSEGDFQAATGTLIDIVRALAVIDRTSSLWAPTHIRQVNLRRVYEATLASAEKAGISIGAPFTRPPAHPEHRQWFAAREVHRALSAARAKVRKMPGPKKRRGRAVRMRKQVVAE